MSSVSNNTNYKNACKEASNGDKFHTFKSNPHYKTILEHVSENQGSMYLDFLNKNFPEYKNNINKFKNNDKYGSPQTFEYQEIGRISPTTLRYIKVLSDIQNLIGNINNKKIIEIGPGYGGQCFILNQFYSKLNYHLVDLDEALLLNQKYLKELNVEHKIINIKDVESLNEEFDLVISNYAYSELNKESQVLYWEKIIKNSKNGYFTLNFISNYFNIESHTLEEIKSMFSEKNIKIIEKNPKTHQDNVILYF